MNVGFVSTWFERGGAYVTKAYLEAVEAGGHAVFVYARGDNGMGKGNPEWDLPFVTFGLKLWDTNINRRHIYQWIKENKLDAIFFNEQMEFDIVAYIKKDFPKVKLGSYIDYYTETMLKYFNLFDFLICNTHRHMEAMWQHPQKYYVKWGTDIELYQPADENAENQVKVRFFHSAGMSVRKGTDTLIDAFIDGKLFEKAKLIIHTQMDITKQCRYTKKYLEEKDIEVIEETVTAPGLYYLGDVYVYPTRLEGLGLTMYEALAMGMPVIATDFPPMNEIVGEENGKLIAVERIRARADGYYWPLAECSEESLIFCMEYYIKNAKNIQEYKKTAREFAVREVNWKKRYVEINKIFENAAIRALDETLYADAIRKKARGRLSHLLMAMLTNTRLDTLLLKFVK